MISSEANNLTFDLIVKFKLFYMFSNVSMKHSNSAALKLISHEKSASSDINSTGTAPAPSAHMFAQENERKESRKKFL